MRKEESREERKVGRGGNEGEGKRDKGTEGEKEIRRE